jgi:hypothetical protein
MTYVEPNFAYVNPHLDLPKPERVHRHPSTVPLEPDPILALRVHATLAISPLPVRG